MIIGQQNRRFLKYCFVVSPKKEILNQHPSIDLFVRTMWIFS